MNTIAPPDSSTRLKFARPERFITRRFRTTSTARRGADPAGPDRVLDKLFPDRWIEEVDAEESPRPGRGSRFERVVADILTSATESHVGVLPEFYIPFVIGSPVTEKLPEPDPGLDRSYIDALDAIVLQGIQERRETGEGTRLARGIRHLVEQSGRMIVEEVRGRYARGQLKGPDWGDVLLGLAEARDATSHDARFEMLCKSLGDSDAGVRSEAAMALAVLEDPRGADVVQRAAAAEKIAPLRSYMERVASDLRRSV